VRELLSAARILGDGGERRLRPGEICVLVRVNAVGRRIEQGLGGMGIRAVCTGTSSVMHGRAANDLRSLLEAMEKPSHPGRIRSAAATRFFGYRLTEVASLGEERELLIGERIAVLAAILAKRGLAGWYASIMEDDEMMRHLTAGPDGERTIADLAHLVEILQEGTGDRTPSQLLERFLELKQQDDTAELVSRRVESDEDAVTIMTVHNAKGLEFPCVIVADEWKKKDHFRPPALFHADGKRRLDLVSAVPHDNRSSAAGTKAVLEAENEELGRLIYVAATRARHHLCLLVTANAVSGLFATAMPGMAGWPKRPVHELLSGGVVPTPADAAANDPAKVAALPAAVERRYLRTSFSGLCAQSQRHRSDPHAAEEPGTDEGDQEEPTPTEPPGSDSPLEGFTIANLPAGTAFGTVVHTILEEIDTDSIHTGRPLGEEVARVVAEVATAQFLAAHRESLADMITAALQTPFGGPPHAVYRNICCADIGPQDRLTELNFDMALAGLNRGVQASDMGRLLQEFLPADDLFHAYATTLAGPAFDIPLAGLINGSIDAVLRLPGSSATAPRLVIVDYKTNKLHTDADATPLAAYAPERLLEAMADHHYPLQALVYGTALYRMLRWRLRRDDPADCIAGVVYAFLRGMKGKQTPTAADGSRSGVFTWQPPPGLWSRLSGLLAGQVEGVHS